VLKKRVQSYEKKLKSEPFARIFFLTARKMPFFLAHSAENCYFCIRIDIKNTKELTE